MDGDTQYLVRVGDAVEDVEDLKKLPLIDMGIDGVKTICLSDVADVTVTDTDTDGNVFDYVVSELEILEPYAVSQMTEGDWDLTLFTCTPGGQYRVTLRCNRI